jgi:hypothetical protein
MPIKLNSASGGSVTLDVPLTGSTYTHTLPAETGTLITTSTLSGINASAMSVGTVPRSRLPSGSILQLSQTHITDAYAYGVSGYPTMTDTALAASITPLYTTSKIMVMIDSIWGASEGAQHISQRLKRTISGSSTFVGEATNVGSRPISHGGMGSQIAYGTLSNFNYFLGSSYMRFLDSPATTSAITYTMTVCAYTTTTLYLNRTRDDRQGTTYDPRGTSSIILMEIAV